MDVPYLQSHPAAPTQDWDTFEVITGSANVAVRLEENGNPGRRAHRALVQAGGADLSIGPDQDANFQTIYGGTSYQIPDAGNGRQFILGNWWVKSASATQTVKVSYV